MENDHLAQRLAQELNEGDTRSAANILREQLLHDPQDALSLVARARQLESPRGAEDVAIRPDGDVTIVNKWNGQPVAMVGRLPYQQYEGAAPMPPPSQYYAPQQQPYYAPQQQPYYAPQQQPYYAQPQPGIYMQPPGLSLQFRIGR